MKEKALNGLFLEQRKRSRLMPTEPLLVVVGLEGSEGVA